MGYMKHHTIVASGFQPEVVEKARALAVALFQPLHTGILSHEGTNLVSPILCAATNGYSSFCVAPDGSKEGWGTSDQGDVARTSLVAAFREMRKNGEYISWVEMSFDEDDHRPPALVTYGPTGPE